MSPSTFFRLYCIALPVFFAVDLLWLGLVARNFYKKQIGHLMSDQINWPAAVLFYLLFIGGLVIFAIFPAFEKTSRNHAIIYGALFGLMTYATYDLTNMATLKNWPLTLVIVDIAWGIILSTIVSLTSYLIAIRFLQ